MAQHIINNDSNMGTCGIIVNCLVEDLEASISSCGLMSRVLLVFVVGQAIFGTVVRHTLFC